MKKTHRRRSKHGKNKRNERNKTRKIRKASGGNPTELTDEHPIQIVGNKLYVNLNNAYYAGPGTKQQYTGDRPVYIYNLLDLNIDKNGNMFRVDPPDKKVYYGKIDEYNNFTIDTGYKFIDRYPNAIYIDDMIRGIQLMYIQNVMIKPGNSNKEGEFKTVFPLRHERTNEAPITLEQNERLKNKISENADKQAKYIIFDRKNMKMHANYAFIRIFMPTGERKSPFKGGYLEFEYSGLPKTEEKAEVLEELERVVPLMPYEVEGSEIGKEYREARARFESRNPDWARFSPEEEK
jgi:hypothetical protein